MTPAGRSLGVNHLDVCTHIKFPADRDILNRKNFDVNMRLFHSSPGYRSLVQEACHYIEECVSHDHDGYSTPKGWSGANAGIPWRIIAVMVGETPLVMINPIIEILEGGQEVVKSNCGSLTLSEPVEVKRHKSIKVSYYDTQGLPQWIKMQRIDGGYTAQHEVDHTLGILITDKQV